MFAELKLKTTGRNMIGPVFLWREYEDKTLPAEEWDEIKGKYFAFNSYIINASWRSNG